MAPGGTAGQILVKTSNSNFDMQWVDPPTHLYSGTADFGWYSFLGGFSSGQHGLVAKCADRP
ncbi:hypothetical protein [Candidatus Coxiella mudrowiae]|uniref:hypothetical protein n=1 Tax=Candidatus Coxiella mudrowiae TaxID=2054173 RepID=UPI000C28799D|nr:hypothetical protein [Candidatus Coxiella mudrowiae]